MSVFVSVCACAHVCNWNVHEERQIGKDLLGMVFCLGNFYTQKEITLKGHVFSIPGISIQDFVSVAC